MNSEMQTIRQYAKNGPFSEHTLRRLEKEGKLPGVYIGAQKKKLINVPLFLAQIEEASKEQKEIVGGVNNENVG